MRELVRHVLHVFLSLWTTFFTLIKSSFSKSIGPSYGFQGLIERALWVLDEPFTAIDRQGVAALEAQLVAHAQSGGCVLVTTHHALTESPVLRRIQLG